MSIGSMVGRGAAALLGDANAKAPKELYYYDASGNVAYIAYGPQGAASSDPTWRVEQKVWDASGNITGSLWSPVKSIADNYLTLVYS